MEAARLVRRGFDTKKDRKTPEDVRKVPAGPEGEVFAPVTTLGLDIGSRTIKLAVLNNGAGLTILKAPTSHDPMAVCRELLGRAPEGKIVATGYGRRLAASYLGCGTVSEIKAFAVGARRLFPSCRTVLDIGGQDTKAIALGEDGRIERFHMNDKCAAGTGRFLEIMAAALGLSLADFIREASLAESEVISTINTSRPGGRKRE